MGSFRSCALFIVAFTLLVSGCQVHAPEIIQIQGEFRLYAPPSEEEEPGLGLSLFCHVADADGIGDLDEILIDSPGNEIFWKLGPDEWIRREWQGENWYGSSGLRFPGGEIPDTGAIRIKVVDKAGEAAQEEILLSVPDWSDLEFPSLEWRGDHVALLSPYEENVIWVIKGGETVRRFKCPAGLVRLETLLPDSGDNPLFYDLVLYSYSRDARAGLISETLRIYP